MQLTLTPSQRSEFTLYLRIPAWVSGAKLALNGTPQAGVKPGEYLPLRRSWKSGDSVTLNFSMDAEVVASNPRVAEDRGRVAVRGGPVIFRAEELDHRKGVALADLAINLDLRTFQHEYKPDFLDGVMVLHHRGGAFEVSSAEEALYMLAKAMPPKIRPEDLTLIPYYA